MSKTIDLQDVRDALMLSVTKAATNESRSAAGERPLTRWAAYTCYVHRGSFDHRRSADRSLGRLDTMHRGGLPQLVEMVNLQNGSTEVRRTWGTGVRVLRDEFSQGALR